MGNIEYFNYPWKYAVVDDFLPQNIFDQVIEYSKVKGADIPVTETKVYTFEEDEYKDLRQDIISITEEFKELAFDKLNEPQKDIMGASISTYLHIREPGHSFGIHPDSWGKVFSLVLYLYPFEGPTGTTIYTPGENPQLVTEIKWKPNRMLAFVPSHNPQIITNHRVQNFTEANRVALVVNYLSGNKDNQFK